MKTPERPYITPISKQPSPLSTSSGSSKLICCVILFWNSIFEKWIITHFLQRTWKKRSINTFLIISGFNPKSNDILLPHIINDEVEFTDEVVICDNRHLAASLMASANSSTFFKNAYRNGIMKSWIIFSKRYFYTCKM